jgi:F-type H+-transporting ATPase subunit alpha
MALLKQPQYSPYPLPEMTLSLWIGTTGRLDRVPVDDVLRFEQEFLDFLGRQHKDLLDGIRESRLFDDAAEEKASSAYDEFLDQFETSEGQSIKPGTQAKADPVTDEELEQEQIVKQKRDGASGDSDDTDSDDTDSDGED